MSIPVAVRSKAYVCGRLIAEIAVSNPAESMHLFVVCCEGSGLCDGLIIRSEESYRVCVCLIVRDLETSTLWRPRAALVCCATEEKLYSCLLLHYIR